MSFDRPPYFHKFKCMYDLIKFWNHWHTLDDTAKSKWYKKSKYDKSWSKKYKKTS